MEIHSVYYTHKTTEDELQHQQNVLESLNMVKINSYTSKASSGGLLPTYTTQSNNNINKGSYAYNED